jgi:hypothetical protein
MHNVSELIPPIQSEFLVQSRINFKYRCYSILLKETTQHKSPGLYDNHLIEEKDAQAVRVFFTRYFILFCISIVI